MTGLIIALVLATLAGLLLAVVGWLGLTRRLPPNPVAGIRTPYTFSSDEAWYATHEGGGPILLFGGVAIFAIGLALVPFALLDMLGEPVIGVAVLVQVMSALLAAIGSWQVGVRRAKQGPGSTPPTTPTNDAPNAS